MPLTTALRSLPQEEPISATDLAGEIFKHHPEYAGDAAGGLQLQRTSIIKPGKKWLEEIKTLLDPMYVFSS